MFRLAHDILACLQHGPSLRDFFSIGACVSVWTVFSCTGLALCELANGNGISCFGSLFILLSRVPASGLGPLKTASLLPSRSLVFWGIGLLVSLLLCIHVEACLMLIARAHL